METSSDEVAENSGFKLLVDAFRPIEVGDRKTRRRISVSAMIALVDSFERECPCFRDGHVPGPREADEYLAIDFNAWRYFCVRVLFEGVRCSGDGGRRLSNTERAFGSAVGGACLGSFGDRKRE